MENNTKELYERLKQCLPYLTHTDVVGMNFVKCSSVMAEQVKKAISNYEEPNA